MLSLDPGRGCNVFTMQLALVLTGCSGDIGLPMRLGLCFEPYVRCAGQFIGRETRFEYGHMYSPNIMLISKSHQAAIPIMACRRSVSICDFADVA